MLHQLSIGLSGMRAAQIGLDVTGNNLANANTPGYRRQSPIFAERAAHQIARHWLGSGVDTQRVRQARAELVGNQLLSNTSDHAAVRAQLDVSLQIETRLNPSSGSVAEQFDAFQSAVESLAAAPFDAALRQTTLQSAVSLTRQLNKVSLDLLELDRTVQGRVSDAVGQVNALAEQIAALNFEIGRQSSHSNPNTLIDQRNALVSELSELVDVRLDERANRVTIAGGSVVVAQRPPLKLAVESGQVVIAGNGQVIQPGGLIGGLLESSQQIIPRARERLDHLALGFSLALDPLHSQGVGLEGQLLSVTSSRHVEDAAAVLQSQGSPFPLSSGSIFVGVTELETGQRRLHEVTFDPGTQSLQDLAAALNALPGVNSAIDSTGRLVVRGNSGFGFDFSGRPESSVDASGLSGTSVPAMSGLHDGENRRVEFEFLGAGEIGVTAGLQVEARDADTGQVIGVFDIGQGYAPTDPIALPDGAAVHFGVGSVVAGEQFETRLVSNADETGALVRLGVNTLFSGSTAADLTVHAELLDDPQRLAASVTGEAGDSSVLLEMIRRRDRPVYPDSSETLQDALFTATGAIGYETNALSIEEEGLALVGEQLFVERESVEGVDPNEELVEMLKFQRSFEAMARYVTAVNQTLEDLMRIIR